MAKKKTPTEFEALMLAMPKDHAAIVFGPHNTMNLLIPKTLKGGDVCPAAMAVALAGTLYLPHNADLCDELIRRFNAAAEQVLEADTQVN